jgi:hypothetical protein
MRSSRRLEGHVNLINHLFVEKRVAEARFFQARAEAHKAAVNHGLKKAVLETEAKEERRGASERLQLFETLMS